MPLAAYQVHSGPAPTCKLLGVERSFGSAQLKANYADIGMDLDASTKILDAAIGAGYQLHTVREAIVNAQQSKATSAFGTR